METWMKVLIGILIAVIIYLYVLPMFYSTEKFESGTTPELVLFFSDTCGHCVNFKNNWYSKFIQKLRGKKQLGNIRIIHADEPEHQHLFSKYNVQYVPTGLIRDRDATHYKIIEGLAVQDEDGLDAKVRQCEDAWDEIKKDMK